ncbi:LysR substrate-binding domain-containing protein [Congregibacter variabilis]|uniref:LysR substrate-binding domain-containing protein n=1 Tax=Congregibacter variabilis TaxID=3081200 RepID=A0ABZ0I1H5_9GAMM|nr:LysR substrate-binding domain-containing protein [Congregibacter sp. IMCC43200]
MDLNDYFYFVHVVEKRGFAPASRALDIPKSRLSRHVQQLEKRLGIRLIQRTSRQFAVTDVGLEFYRHARCAIESMEAADAAVTNHTQTLSGRVRISCSVGMAQFALSQIVPNFLINNPNVEITQQVSNETVDLVESGIDIALRGHMGPLPDSSLIQRVIAPSPWRLFAGQTYRERVDLPTTPEELRGHAGLKMGWTSPHGEWSLRGSNKEQVSVPFCARLCSDDMVTLKQAASDGLGIVALPAYVCRKEILSGQLLHVLPNWSAGDAHISVVMPSRKGVPPVVRAFCDVLGKELPRVTAL